MKKCLKCGFRTEEEINFCPECGERLARVVIKKKEPEPVVEEPEVVVEETAQPEAVAEVSKPETVASNVDKTRFNDKIKKAFFMDFIGSIIFFAFSILVFFLKIFKSVEEIDFFGQTIVFEEKFSIYDVVRDFFKALKNDNLDAVDSVSRIYTVFFSVYFIMFAIFMLVKIITSIYKMMDMEVYCLEKVNLLEKTGQINAKTRYKGANTLSLVISAFFMVLLIIIIDKIPYAGAHMYDGVTGLIAIVAILAVGGLVPVIISAVLLDQVKKQFLREKK